MNPTNEAFLAILRAGLRGEPADPGREIPVQEWQTLLQMAGAHKVLPLFFEAVHPLIRQAEPALAASVKLQARNHVILQAMRTGEFLELNRALRAAGATPLVVKGVVCRDLYPRPDHRPSADEDVLIPPEQFDLCHRVLTEFGMQTTTAESEREASYELPYRKAGSPLYIELHRQLFAPESAAYGDLNRFFAEAFDRSITLELQGESVRTLGHTDHLFYLICHAFKHFLHSGFGIRQICDILLYAERWGSCIDWALVLENCRAIRADRFAAALFSIGSRHLTFDQDRAAYPECWRAIQVDETALLEDVLRAGVYGTAEGSRQHSSAITLDAVAAEKQGRRAKGALRASLFPSAKALEGRFPWLKQHPYLLPAAWCSRLLRYSREVSSTQNNSAADALKLGSERVALLRRYGIIE